MEIIHSDTGLNIKIDRGLDGKQNIWLDQNSISVLFQKDRTVITKHIKKIYKDGEASDNSFRDIEIIGTEGKNKGKKYKVREYSLDIILFVGYKINSKRGSEFRKWTNEVLGEYLKNNGGINFLEGISSVNKKEGGQKEGYIYLIESQGFYKIGKAINLESRQKKYITENPHPIRIVHSYKVSNYTEEEKRLHKKFERKRYRGEWFKLNEEDLNIIIRSRHKQES